jgi:NAD/NADP transhydrogenase beta subunit
MSGGFAGIDKPLFYKHNTSMLFGYAKQPTQEITQQVKELGSPVGAA